MWLALLLFVGVVVFMFFASLVTSAPKSYPLDGLLCLDCSFGLTAFVCHGRLFSYRAGLRFSSIPMGGYAFHSYSTLGAVRPKDEQIVYSSASEVPKRLSQKNDATLL